MAGHPRRPDRHGGRLPRQARPRHLGSGFGRTRRAARDATRRGSIRRLRERTPRHRPQPRRGARHGRPGRHNPGLEGLAETLIGDWVPLPTSALAVIELDGPWRSAGRALGCYARPGAHLRTDRVASRTAPRQPRRWRRVMHPGCPRPRLSKDIPISGRVPSTAFAAAAHAESRPADGRGSVTSPSASPGQGGEPACLRYGGGHTEGPKNAEALRDETEDDRTSAEADVERRRRRTRGRAAL